MTLNKPNHELLTMLEPISCPLGALSLETVLEHIRSIDSDIKVQYLSGGSGFMAFGVLFAVVVSPLDKRMAVAPSSRMVQKLQRSRTKLVLSTEIQAWHAASRRLTSGIASLTTGRDGIETQDYEPPHVVHAPAGAL